MAKFIEFTLNNLSAEQQNTALLNVKSVGMVHLPNSAAMTINSIPRRELVYQILGGVDMDQSYVDALNNAVLEAARSKYPHVVVKINPSFTFSQLVTI